MTYSTPPTFSAGAILTAAQLNAYLRDNFKAIGDASGTYTPTWDSTGTAPTLGNGTISGRYSQVGKWVRGTIELTIGSTTTLGTGVYTFTIPAAAVAGSNTALGSAMYYDDSGPAYLDGICYLTTLSTTRIALVIDAGRFSPSVPVVPATSDKISVSFQYEAA